MNFKLIAGFQRWDLVLWLIWAAMFFVLEGIGLARRQDATLTALLRNAVPRWILAAVLGWLSYHFLIQTTAK